MRIRSLTLLIFVLSAMLATSALAAPANDEPAEMRPLARGAAAVVEWIDWGDLHYEHPSFIFYGPRQDLDTNPCVTVPETVVYGRVPNGGGRGDAQQLLTGCDAPQMTWFLVDSSDIYFIRKQLSEYVLVRRDIGGSPPDEILDRGVEPKALAIDLDYVYYAKGTGEVSLDLGIWRIPRKGSPTPEKVVDVFDIVDNQINRLLINNSKIYWTEGAEANGAVRVAQKNGGPWAGIAMAGVEGAQDIKADADYIYWSEVGGRIMRWDKTGGAPVLLHAAEYPVHYIDVGEDRLVFTQGNGRDGSIWRMPSAGGTADPLVSAQASPGPIAVNSGYIYWNSAALKRIPRNADPIKLDYIIDWAEVTQAIQNGSNDVPLVAQHATYVRVYAHEKEGESPALVRAALHAKGPGGAPLAGSPLISGYVDVPKEMPSRADTEQTFLFTLPEDWVRPGNITLELEINPNLGGEQAFETNKINNQYSAGKINFASKGMCVVTYPVAAVTVFMGVELVVENNDIYQQTYERAETMLPAPLSAHPTGLQLWKANGDPFDLRIKADREELKSTMETLAAFGDTPFSCGPSFTAVQGLVHPNAELPDNPEGGKSNGQGFTNPPVSWIQMSKVANITDGYNSPGSGRSAAHELAHTTGNGHIGCNVTPQDNSYPYPVERLDFNDNFTSHWGFDGITESAINPEENADFRSYCSPRWVSDYTWKNMGGFPLLNARENAPLADHMDAPALTMDFTYDSESGAGSIGTGWLQEEEDLTAQQLRLLAEGEAQAGADTDFGIALRGARGNLLALHPVEKEEPHEPEEPGVGGVIVYSDLNVVEFDMDTDVIQLVDRRSSTVVDEVKVSDNHPVVTAVEAAFDERKDSLAVSWEARDPDGDKMQYIVRYSNDGGEKWRSMAVEIKELTIKIPAKDLPGAARTGVVQVIATDGVHTGMAVSKPFSLPMKSPKAWIMSKPTSPEQALEVMEGDTLALSGRAYDPEDGPLSGRSLTWLLDGNVVANGRWLHLAGLTPGKHNLILEVMDSNGSRARDSVELMVDELPGPTPPPDSISAVYLPLVLLQ